MREVIGLTTLMTREKREIVPHPPGARVWIEGEEAQSLVDRGLARFCAEQAGKSAEEPDELIQTVKCVMEDPDPEELTDAGVPRVQVLSEMLGRTVSAAERDAVLAKLYPEDL